MTELRRSAGGTRASLCAGATVPPHFCAAPRCVRPSLAQAASCAGAVDLALHHVEQPGQRERLDDAGAALAGQAFDPLWIAGHQHQWHTRTVSQWNEVGVNAVGQRAIQQYQIDAAAGETFKGGSGGFHDARAVIILQCRGRQCRRPADRPRPQGRAAYCSVREPGHVLASFGGAPIVGRRRSMTQVRNAL